MGVVLRTEFHDGDSIASWRELVAMKVPPRVAVTEVANDVVGDDMASIHVGRFGRHVAGRGDDGVIPCRASGRWPKGHCG